MTTKTLFISYSSKDKAIIKEIESYLSVIPESELKLVRDTKAVGYKQSFKVFMQSIQDQDYALLFISDNFLKSEWCMFEVLEVMKDKNFDAKTLYVFSNQKPAIFTFNDRKAYADYWSKQAKNVQAAITEKVQQNQAVAQDEQDSLKRYQDINSNIQDFLAKVVGQQVKTHEEFEKEQYKSLLDFMNIQQDEQALINSIQTIITIKNEQQRDVAINKFRKEYANNAQAELYLGNFFLNTSQF